MHSEKSEFNKVIIIARFDTIKYNLITDSMLKRLIKASNRLLRTQYGYYSVGMF